MPLTLRMLLTLPIVGFATLRAVADDAPLFRNRVAPLFEARCLRCHAGAEPKGALNLSTAAAALTGGDSGPAFVPGKPDDSLLVDAISGDKPEMPKEGPPLSADEVAAIRRWIADGANWPAGVVLAEKRAVTGDWWSLKPLARVAVPTTASPWIRTPIDAFILAKLNEQQLRRPTKPIAARSSAA